MRIQVLSFSEMLEISGGVSLQEYCDTVSTLIENNWSNWTEDQRKAAADAYSKHC